MSIPLNILKILKCCLSNDNHIVSDAVLLQCGGNACKSCCSFITPIKCLFCLEEHVHDEVIYQKNPQIEELLNNYLSELITSLKHQLNDAVNYYENYQLNFKKKLSTIENQIDVKTEVAKTLIDLTHNEFKTQLDGLKTSILKARPIKVIQSTKLKYASEHSFNLSTFYEFQNDLINLKQRFNDYFTKVDSIRFKQSAIPIDRTILGYIQHPFSNNYSCSRSIILAKIPQTKNLVRMAYSIKQQIIYAVDHESCSIKILTSNGAYLNVINHEYLFKPWAVCLDDEELFIGDQGRHEILVFSLHYNYRLTRKFGKGIVKIPSAIKIDMRCEAKRILFVADWSNNEITLWNCKNGDLLHKLDIDSPSQIEIKNNKLFIVSTINGFITTRNRKLQWITKGSNCLFIVDLVTLKVKFSLTLDSWLKLRGLQIDDDLNIIVSAYELNKKNEVSPNRYLFSFNQSGCLINKIRFTNNGIDCNDLLLIGNKLVSCYADTLSIVNF
jgi:hypothetical protein